MKNIFKNHPNSVGETYVQHLGCACGIAANMLLAGFACLIHGIFPFLFKTTASDRLVKTLHGIVERTPCNQEHYIALSQLIEEKSQSHTD
ncbi:MAG TPA: DUF6356 family protein [Gammaproteobacteria bacterium]|jgi:hypothetical protein|nr:DUF6356 family protein [Gammaproteobacteria bacterium]